MVRIGRLALVLAVGLALSAKEAQAQFYYPGYYGPGWCALGPYWWHSYGRGERWGEVKGDSHQIWRIRSGENPAPPSRTATA